MRDEIIQPAFAIFNSPGKYALLLGSGISRAAEIMTAQQIIRDLIGQVAAALDEQISGSPEEWYAKRFGQEPGYDLLLEALGKTQLDRKAILKDYFEPTDEELEDGIKQPTNAHKAIAWLVKHKYVRIILTTNFDRLMENALNAEGVAPNVISTEEQAVNREPIQHYDNVIIKLHGDYLDEHTRNTADELRNYDLGMQELLEQVVREYGLIVCGWSGETDTALREALEQNPSKYATYWAAHQSINDKVSGVAERRNIQIVGNISADDFFAELQQSVEALEGADNKPPLTTEVAIQRVKRLIEQEKPIQLEEMIWGEIGKSYSEFASQEFYDYCRRIALHPSVAFEKLPPLYYEKTNRALHMIAALCWHGSENQGKYVVKAINEWEKAPKLRSQPNWQAAYFPVVFLAYVAGIATVYRGNWAFLSYIFTNSRIKLPNDANILPFTETIGDEINHHLFFEQLGIDHRDLSRYLERQLFPIFMPYLSKEEYFYAFDLFETVISVIYLHTRTKRENKKWMPGQLAVDSGRSWAAIEHFWYEGGTLRSDWEFRTKFFAGNSLPLIDALELYGEIVSIFRSDQVKPNYYDAYRRGLDDG